LLLGPVVNLGLVLEAGARHRLAELGVLVERDALDGLEPRVVGVLGAVDEPRLDRRRLILGGLLRRRRILCASVALPRVLLMSLKKPTVVSSSS